MSLFLRHAAQRVLFFDGSMGATIQSLPLEIDRDYLGRENCVDVLVRSRPELVQQIHESFLAVGADAVETDTFGASRHVFAEFDEELVSWTRALNKEAAEIARAACDRHSTSDKPRFVVGSIGPGTKLISLGQITWQRMLDSYCEQVRGLLDGGADALLIETCQDLLQVKCAINSCLKALDERGKGPTDIPIMVSVTIETTGTMLLGSEIAAAVHALKPYPIASLGLNCATGPVEMAEHLKVLSRHWDRLISVMPNAGLPVMVEGKTTFPLQPAGLRDALRKFVDDFGVNFVGGCCGTGPEHIRQVVEAIGVHKPVPRGCESTGPSGLTRLAPVESGLYVQPPACVTSLYSPVECRQENSFLIVGERLNASGSRKFKRLLEEENWDEIISLAREQKREGANVLDLNVDYAGRDNARDMAEIVTRVVRQVDCPLMIDSTQIATLEAGLMHAAGKCIINSANFEEGPEKFDEICTLARRYGAALVIGTIDEDKEAAMARTADRKFSIAQRALQRATQVHGFDPADVFFDPLVLPISTGMDADRRSSLELIEGTKRISKAFPQCQITCGLSNASFGLKPAARVVLNSCLLHELLEAGMTSAIVHASKILPRNRISDEQWSAALDLIYDRRAESKGGTGLPEGVTDESFDPLQHFIGLFKDEDALSHSVEERVHSLEEALQAHIVEGEKQGMTERLDEALQKYSPLEIINDHLLAGMKTVGELFGSGQMQLPFVLQSAEVMKMAVAHLEPHMDKVAGTSRGSIVLATVKGDVHDIGKNLVDIILTNNGYKVHNLGIKQPIGSIVDALRETGALAIGMSGLLVKSVGVMEQNLAEMNEMGIDAPVLLGGAALTRKYAEGRLRGLYRGPLFYGQDAFEGLRIMDAITSGQAARLNGEIDQRVVERGWGEARADLEAHSCAAAGAEARSGRAGGSAIATVAAVSAPPAAPAPLEPADVPAAPFLGTRVIESIDLDQIYPYINTTALFRGQWGFKRGSLSDPEYQQTLTQTVEPLFARLKTEMREKGILTPRVVYGYYPVASEGNDVIVFDPNDPQREIERFSFPRQQAGKHRCIADFFRPVGSEAPDVLGLFVCTMGPQVSEVARRLFEGNEYTEYLYTHGMGVETAEALAELWHKRMRQELGIDGDDATEIRRLFSQKYRGSRYSFGYPACPNMEDQAILFRLLQPERIGCQLTENFQIDPEQSVSAMVVHHPGAKYFNA
ncbi:MAG: methionine synthase [Phycisphaerales bacterium]|nr:methionine synthase [Phycisphaerales bacterium]